MNKHIRCCPICGSPGSIIYTNELALINDFDMSYEVHSCLRCGGVFADNIPTEDLYHQYYSRFSKYDVGGLSSDNMAMHEALADIIISNVPKNTRILDVGCGGGHLLACLKARGMHNLYGIDPAPHAAKAAQAAYDIENVEIGFLEDLPQRQGVGQFGLICLSAVLEHLTTPRTHLESLLQKLPVGVYVAVEVPDLDSFDGKDGEPFGELSLEHINYFSTRSLKWLFASLGCHMVHSCVATHSTGASLLALVQKNNDIRFPGKTNDTSVMESYIASSEANMAPLLQWAGKVVTTPCLIYGGGSHTARFLPRLERLGLKECFIGIIDNNPNLEYCHMAGLPLMPASKLVDYHHTNILISSFRYELEIRNSLHEHGGEVFTLYEGDNYHARRAF